MGVGRALRSRKFSPKFLGGGAPKVHEELHVQRK